MSASNFSSIGVFLRGMLMGAADVVPGVSGGTMALITGIYTTLLASVRAFDLEALRLLLAGEFKALWQHVNGCFLLALLAGIGTSVLTMARGISYLLVHHPVPLWAFFFGLILASAIALLFHVMRWGPAAILALIAGTAIALFISLSSQIQLGGGLFGVFVAGFIAICAMILPGISGSFILLLLGMYAPVLAAVSRFDLPYMAVFAVGAAAGLMCFSRLLYFLLRRFVDTTMAMLSGFLFGSLAVVWPWKEVLQWTTDRHGEPKVAQQIPVLPERFAELGGQPQLWLCLGLAVIGAVLVWQLESRYGRKLNV
ncbi:MAG: DUF368 domain-containing protein [Gammaproteobacteria bacterium]|nr:MAG: DUF368 domain-containing protein [Gammaproteobacteria bacterium]